MSDRWLLARSQENIIIFYFKEMLETRSTGCKPDVPNSTFKNLKKWGLLNVERNGHYYVHVLSPRCLAILKDFEESKMKQKTAPKGPRNSPMDGLQVPGSASSPINIKEGDR